MTVTVVSGFNPEGYAEYGRLFLDTFDKHWPTAIPLVVYTESDTRMPSKRCTQRDVLEIPGCREFIESHTEPKYHGLEPVPGWNKKDDRAGYSWRYDVVKFCRQLFIPDDAAKRLPDGDILVWLDADVVTYQDVPMGFIERLLAGRDLITMGRDGSSTELGFWAVRLKPNTRLLLSKIADSYCNGDVFKLHEWHSGYVFDYWVDRFKVDKILDHKSLTSGRGHIWFQCEIGRYTDHMKGPMRKKIGFSPERHGRTVRQYMGG